MGACGTGGSGRIVPSSPSLQEEGLNLVDDTGDRLLAVSKRLVLLWARLADEVQLKEGKGRLSNNTCHALLHAQFQCDRAGGSLDDELKGLYWPGQKGGDYLISPTLDTPFRETEALDLLR